MRPLRTAKGLSGCESDKANCVAQGSHSGTSACDSRLTLGAIIGREDSKE